MSLRSLVRLTLVLLAFVFVALGGWRFGPALARFLADAQVSTTLDADIDGRALVYRLQRDTPLEFINTQPADLVRILVQAAVKPEERDRVDGFVYTIEGKLYGVDGEHLATHVVSLHADSPDLVFSSGESWRFFRNRPEVAAGMDDVVFEGSAPIGRSEWRLLDADPAILAVDIRVSERRPLTPSEALSNFRRRSREEQADLALGNAFPPDMMTAREKANAAANMWRPLGPIGIAGRDYEALVLYEGTRRGETGAGE